jgi:hypothetical protein
VVLAIGFGGLLACILGAALRTVGTLDHVRKDENRSLNAYLERQSALDQIRSQIYLSGTYVRDLLLAPDPSAWRAWNANPRRPLKLIRARWSRKRRSRFAPSNRKSTTIGGS